MARTAIGLGALCLVTSCALEHPISRSLDVNPIEVDAARPDAPHDVVDAAVPLDSPDVPVVMDAPDVLVPSDVPDVPVVMDAPDVPVAMDAPDVPELPDVVDVPELPDVVDAPELPDVVDAPELPDVVDVPVLPDVVDVIVDSGPTVYESCEAVRLAGLPSGVYLVRAGAAAPWSAYCDTSDSTGAWTLVLKADGRQRTFAFDVSLWTDTALLNETAVNLDRTEAKYEGFVSMPMSAIRVQMVAPADASMSALATVQMSNLSGATLQSVLAARNYVDLSSQVSASTWLSLAAGSSVQSNCRRRGFNARSNSGSNARVRIGMVGNENGGSAECASHDSWIGVGGAGSSCGTLDQNTVGNVACNNGGGGARDIRAFAWVWVR
ncbi:MAG: hypothetical protein R3A48_05375 [Polyangiales bacterium]